MKKNILCSLFAALLLPAVFNIALCNAEGRVIERLYTATDKGAYISGEAMWISVYCFDISNNSCTLSGLSNIAYLEVHNSTGIACTCKIALKSGRGSGRLVLPPTLPTGNYRLIGYTKQMLNEDSVVFSDKLISIYNTLTSDRVPGNVEVKIGSGQSNRPANKSQLIKPTDSTIILKVNGNKDAILKNNHILLSVANAGKERVTLNISVVKEDSIPAPSAADISSVLSGYMSKVGNVNFTDRYTPEYEGEIIKGKIFYNGPGLISEQIVFLSAARGISDIYSSLVDSKGNIAFYTNSIYGDREIILEVPKADTSSKISFEINDPFLRASIKTIPGLCLSKNVEQSLSERSIEMQIGRRFEADTLFEKIQVHNDPLLRVKPIVYNLDEYTRFPFMQDVVVEFISELRFRNIDGKTDLQMRLEEGFKTMVYSRNNTLVLIDGIPVFDHKKVLDYDPLKVKSLSLYGKRYAIGVAGFSGIVSLKTYKGDYSGLKFDKNVRIMDFQGALYPCRFTAKELVNASRIPDLRSTLFFDPQIDIEPGGKKDLTIYTPSYSGTFKITVEGVDQKGKPFLRESFFTVK